MEELQLTLTPSRVDQRNFGLMLSNWRVGQVLNALVVDRMPSGNVLLSVGGREFVTSLDLPVQAGSRLQLEVQQLQPQVTLKMLGKGSDIGSTQLAQSNSQSLLFSTSASSTEVKPASVASLLATLSAQPGFKALAAQVPVLNNLIAALAPQSLQANALSSSALAALIGRSGLFNEANLAGDRGDRARNSSKTVLAQLQKAISELSTTNLNSDTRSALSALSDLTNAALANLTQQQLASIPQDSGAQRWCFGIPLAYRGDFLDLNLIVERDKSGTDSSSEEQTWRVDLLLTLPEIGPLRVLMTMKGREVSAIFNSDSARVRALADSSFGLLKDRMIFSDFRVKSLATCAMADSEDGSSAPSSPHKGVEVRV